MLPGAGSVDTTPESERIIPKEIKNWSDSGLYLVKNNNGVYLTIWSDRMSKQTLRESAYKISLSSHSFPQMLPGAGSVDTTPESERISKTGAIPGSILLKTTMVCT
jgi:hypothetical protein